MKRLLPFLVLVFTASQGYCQSLKDTVKLKEVFVTSSKVLSERAFNIKKVDSLVLINSIDADLSDLLLKNSSLYIKSYGAGGLATASFRGTSASHTQVLWNGLNINSPLWGQTDLSLIPVFFTDDVSLLYGSSSLAKASGGLGGCISLTNTPTWDAGTHVSLSQTAGSYGYLLSQLKVGYSREKFVSKTRLFLDKAKNNFRYYDNASGSFDYTRQKNAEYDKKGFLQELYYKINRRQFAGIKIMNVWSDRNLPPIMSFGGADRYENQTDTYLNLIGEWKYYGSKSNLSFNTGLIRNELNYILTNTNQGGTVVNYNTKSLSDVFSNKLNFQHNFSEKTILKTSADAVFIKAHYTDIKGKLGFEVERTDLTLQSSLHHAFSSVLSGYALAQQKLLDGSLMPLVAATGLEYKLCGENDLILRSNVGKNLHVPNLNDMYFTPGGNRNLKPEEGYQADAGLQWTGGEGDFNYQVEVTGFAALIDNWILWHPSEFRYWIADNVRKVFSRGTEINTNLKGEIWLFHYNIKGNYGFTRTTDEEKESFSKGMQLIYIPQHIGNAHMFLERDDYSAVFSWHFTGPRFSSTVEDKVHQMGAHSLFDLGVGKKFRIRQHTMNFNFKLNNIFNKQYQVIEQRAMPGRNFSVSLSFNFNSY